MYKVYQRRIPHHERILESQTETQLVLARPSQYLLRSAFSFKFFYKLV